MLALFLFFLDFCCHALFQGWFVHSLLCLFTIQQLQVLETQNAWKTLYVPLFLLLLQDCYLYGRFGFILILLIPCIFIYHKLKYIILHTNRIALPLCIGLFLGSYDFLAHYVIFSHNFSPKQTFIKIFVNICVAYIILLGTRGNRFLLTHVDKKRKVWTPNRKGAL